MFSTAYLTTPVKGYNLKEVIDGIRAEYALNWIGGQLVTTDFGVGHLVGAGPLTATMRSKTEGIDYTPLLLVDGHANIPLFAHPIDIELDSGSYKNIITVCDARGLAKKDLKGNLSIGSHAEWVFQQARAVLSSYWTELVATKETRAASFDFGTLVFSRWVAETIATRFGVGVDAQLRIQILAAHHFISMHMPDDTPMDSKTETLMAMKIHNVTRLPSDAITDVLNGLDYTTDINGFVENIRTKSNSITMEKFDLAALYTILRGRWFGKAANEVVNVALEHPPTWYAIVYSSLTVSSYESTSVGKIAKQEAKNHTAEAMLRAIATGITKGVM